ncbi:chaplin [Streptomyces hainanensis]|uniref:Chaplin n=1 Tax=Streptomyces hainanensis TaxID=402648 RepID=A0A4R4TMS1_9ACTN|nr:chaplin [Streptomyces hainanensis]TDC77976.1 chaplin [Streptomyces hainanensis]
MRQVRKKGLLTVVAAGGVFAISGGTAFADSDAAGSAVGSPGVASGNNVEVPVDVPVQVCGNTNVVGVLNPAFGNKCQEGGGPERPRDPQGPEHPGPEHPGDPGDPGQPGNPGNPGPGSEEPEGQMPHDPAAGDPETAEPGPRPAGSVAEAPAEESAADGELAETGSELPLGAILAVGGGLLIGGGVLYRRARVAHRG